MDKNLPAAIPHPKGEGDSNAQLSEGQPIWLGTASGRVHLEWDDEAAFSAQGQLAFFANFLKAGELFEPFCREAPFGYTSPNAPSHADVLGSALLSILSGHYRYAHLTALRLDTVSPPLLGMSQIQSEDSVRRGIKKLVEENPQQTEQWLTKHFKRTWEPLLREDWILDIDTSVKTIFGKQQGAEVSYNPHKKGRPSHVFHSYFISNIRLCLDTEVHPGNQHAAKHGLPKMWKILDALPQNSRPNLIRGDCAYGSESIISQCERREQDYLFKLRQTSGVKQLIGMMELKGKWKDIPTGWQAIESSLQLSGWSKARRVVIARRKAKKRKGKKPLPKEAQSWLALPNETWEDDSGLYEYAVLVTSLDWPISSIAKLYRDRADCENCFDELKNQWGWSGYTTRDLGRCRLMARLIGLIYNWWSLYTRLVDDRKHHEALTSRPALLSGVARKITHAGQTKIRLSLQHGSKKVIGQLQQKAAEVIKKITAEQLDRDSRWEAILSAIFRRYLGGRPVGELPAPEIVARRPLT